MLMQPAREHMSLEQYLLLVNNSDRHYEYLAIPAVVEEVAEENELQNDNDE